MQLSTKQTRVAAQLHTPEFSCGDAYRWTYGRMDRCKRRHNQTNISRIHRLPNSVSYGAPRARAFGVCRTPLLWFIVSVYLICQFTRKLPVDKNIRDHCSKSNFIQLTLIHINLQRVLFTLIEINFVHEKAS